MAKFQAFDCFVVDLSSGRHNLVKDDIRIMLTNDRPLKKFRLIFSVKEIAWNRNYRKGGKRVKLKIEEKTTEVAYYAVKDVTWKRKYRDPIGPFRYVVLYNYSNKRLIGFHDYGNSVALSTPKDRSFTWESSKDEFGKRLPVLSIAGPPAEVEQSELYEPYP